MDHEQEPAAKAPKPKEISFVNPAWKPLVEQDLDEAAAVLGCDVAVIKAVVQVESAGSGYLRTNEPKILFESRWFNELTDGRFLKSHPHLATRTWVRNYRTEEGEYDRLREAMTLDQDAALASCSWGKFQILGVHYAAVFGYREVLQFVRHEVDEGEASHLSDFVIYVEDMNLRRFLEPFNPHLFAAAYNGPGYRKMNYARNLIEAVEFFGGGSVLCGPTGLNTIEELQQRLNHHGARLDPDGIVGPLTRQALVAFQKSRGLAPDGIAGPVTWAALMQD